MWFGFFKIIVISFESVKQNARLSYTQTKLIRERQREGIALAKQRGAYRGRKKALAPERVAELRRRAAAGEPKAQLAREFGISRETLYQYLKTND